jgi:hypothetical protein
MKKKKYLLLLLSSLFLLNFPLLAQDDNDSTDTRWCKWGRYDLFHWSWHFKGNPFIEADYGNSALNQSKLVSKFADAGLIELKLGYSKTDEFDDNVAQFKERYLFVSKGSNAIRNDLSRFDRIGSETWQWGAAERTGYGYSFGKVNILPYSEEGLVWSRIDMKNSPADFYLLTNPPMAFKDAYNDWEILNRFHDAVRFGTRNEGGIRFDLAKHFSVNAGYEAAVIFPRYLFWKQIGSFAIKKVCDNLLDQFIDEVGDSSPLAVPVVNFLLKNGLSYAFYTLEKNKMNWPFDTEAPLTYETIKIGMTFAF